MIKKLQYREFIIRLCLVIASFALCLGFIEYSIPYFFPVNIKTLEYKKIKLSNWERWELKPNQRITSYKGIKLSTNKHGCRDINFDHILTKKDPRPLLLITGDSFVQGAAVDDKDTIAQNIRRSLKSYKVISCGQSGYNTFDTLSFYRYKLNKFNPDTILHVFFVNDLECEQTCPSGELPHDLKKLQINHGRVVTFLAKKTNIGRLFFFYYDSYINKNFYIKKMQYLFSKNNNGYQAHFDSLNKLKTTLTKDKISLKVVIFPALVAFDNYPFKDSHKKFISDCKRLGIECFDPTEFFIKSGKKARELHANIMDTHGNQEAYYIFSEFIQKKVLSKSEI